MIRESEQLQMEAMEGDNTLKDKADADSTSKRRMVDKTFRKLMFRQQSVALGRWKDVCVHRGAQEAKARQVLNQLRNGLVR